MAVIVIVSLGIMAFILGTLGFAKISKWTKAILGILVVGLAFGTVPHFLLRQLQQGEYYHNNITWQPNNVIVLLGAGLVAVPGLKSVEPAFFSYSRIQKAASLYYACKHTGAHCEVWVSGGDVQNLGSTEAEIYAKALTDVGLNSADIVLETKSKNTYQNAQNISAMLQNKKEAGLVLVTSGIHMQRSMLYFVNFGLHPIPDAADYIFAPAFGLPLGVHFAYTDFAMHEYLGMARLYFYNFMGWNKS